MRAVGQALINELSTPSGETSQFDQAVNSHYAGMYDNIKRISAELSLLDKANKENEEMGMAHSDGSLI
jgi:hypothetical protein